MKKEFEEISQLLDQRASELADKRSARITEIKNAEKKYMELQKSLDNAESAEDYIRIKKEIKEQEEACRFLTSHKNREPRLNLSKAEFKEISEKVNNETRSLMEEFAPKIAKALEAVIELADQYCDQAEALDSLLNRASILANGYPRNKYIVRDIQDTVEDPLTYIHSFYRGYFQSRENICIAKEAVKKGPNSWGSRMNNETGPIYKYLMSLKAENPAQEG